MTPLPPSHILNLPSVPESVRLVEPFLRSLKEVEAMDSQRFHNLLVACTEAVYNAVIHGNQQDPSKNVEVAALVNDGVLTITVTDEGGGFDAAAVPDPRLPENLRKEGGRGVFLMRMLVTEVVFEHTDIGTTVTLRYNL